MNLNPIEFQDMAESAVGSVGTGERRIFANEDKSNKMYSKTDHTGELQYLEMEGQRIGTEPIGTGIFVNCQMSDDFITDTPIGNELYAIPFIPKEDCELVELAWYVTSAGTTNADGIAGIYTSLPGTSPGNYPGTKLVQMSIQIDNSTTGAKQQAVTATGLKGGHLYWLVYWQQNGTTEPTVTAYEGIGMPTNNIGLTTSDMLNTVDAPWGWRVNSGFSGTMPTNFPGGATKMDAFDDAIAIFPRVTLP
jgi:hypothetical protein